MTTTVPHPDRLSPPPQHTVEAEIAQLKRELQYAIRAADEREKEALRPKGLELIFPFLRTRR